jgi:hypothetical protein
MMKGRMNAVLMSARALCVTVVLEQATTVASGPPRLQPSLSLLYYVPDAPDNILIQDGVLRAATPTKLVEKLFDPRLCPSASIAGELGPARHSCPLHSHTLTHTRTYTHAHTYTFLLLPCCYQPSARLFSWWPFFTLTHYSSSSPFSRSLTVRFALLSSIHVRSLFLFFPLLTLTHCSSSTPSSRSLTVPLLPLSHAHSPLHHSC